MEQTWRWFGPEDPVTLSHVRQAGATGIVTALHQHYRGEVWPEADIAARKQMIEAAGLRWSVVESIPVPNAIKLGGPDAAPAIAAFAETMRRLAAAGVGTICYNFMPVVDWTRTDLRYPMPSGGRALRFDMVAFVAYDVFVLARPSAADDYPPALVAQAQAHRATLDAAAIDRLERTIIAGLPGAEAWHDRAGIADLIARYGDTGPDQLRANLTAFHKAIIPVARAHGLRMCIHPDDPPFPLFGLPRVVSTGADYQALFDAVPEVENGITFCTGSLGARRDNDLPALLAAWAERVHFVHLRNVATEDDGSFTEVGHLDGDTDMVTMLRLLRAEEARRASAGRADHVIPFRPDHGHLLLDDQEKQTQPGYSAIGRLKGLAELRGILAALDHAAVA
ncbi:MAG: mannonate dehydratase [Rhodobacterales bacterium]|nr:mannonate dehydratase [Rhodobacterales bacterium]NCT13597.1 mannonate dehydratase [Rhodobacterales bacterium]